MRLIEKCSCGASIEIIWDESSYYHKGEDKRATEELGVWRRAHANCAVSAPAISPDSVEQQAVTPEDEDRIVKAALKRESVDPASSPLDDNYDSMWESGDARAAGADPASRQDG